MAEGNNVLLSSGQVTGPILIRGNIILMYTFLHSDIEAKSGDEFRHWARNASCVQVGMGNGSVLMWTQHKLKLIP